MKVAINRHVTYDDDAVKFIHTQSRLGFDLRVHIRNGCLKIHSWYESVLVFFKLFFTINDDTVRFFQDGLRRLSGNEYIFSTKREFMRSSHLGLKSRSQTVLTQCFWSPSLQYQPVTWYTSDNGEKWWWCCCCFTLGDTQSEDLPFYLWFIHFFLIA